MRGLYLLLDFGSLLVPFIFSFHPSIRFHKEWRFTIPAILLSAIPYLVWDAIFTKQGVWGFNDDYLIGFSFFGLPLEEILFFICIPYACLFTHFALTKLVKNWRLGEEQTKWVSSSIVLLLLAAAITFPDRSYTLVNALFSMLITAFAYWKARKELGSFLLSYLIILIPFFLVNGLLTGSFIDGEVVWYNDSENTGVRLFTIPIEDIFYGFGMLALPMSLAHLLKASSTAQRA